MPVSASDSPRADGAGDGAAPGSGGSIGLPSVSGAGRVPQQNGRGICHVYDAVCMVMHDGGSATTTRRSAPRGAPPPQCAPRRA